MHIKSLIKELLMFLHIDLTKNLQYDRLTKVIIKRIITKNSNCIDIGCHKGDILKLILSTAAQGNHYAFEPIPELYENLKVKFKDRVNIYPYALSDKDSETTFNIVKNDLAYSGIKKRKYAVKNPKIEEINVKLKLLDNIIPPNEKIDFIKIDVEGAEFNVLKGAKEILKKNKPYVIFEFGIGASDYYDTNADEFYNFFVQNIGLKISQLNDFIKKRKPLSLEEFKKSYDNTTDYYFIAHA